MTGRFILGLASLALAACARPSPVEVIARPAAARVADCRFLQPYLDSVHAAGRFPGATLGVAFPDGSSCAMTCPFFTTELKSAYSAEIVPEA